MNNWGTTPSGSAEPPPSWREAKGCIPKKAALSEGGAARRWRRELFNEQ